MKNILLILTLGLLPCFSMAQDAYDRFRKEMAGVESRERELRDAIWGKNDNTQEYKDSVGQILEVLVQDKKDFALRSVRENPDDARFLKNDHNLLPKDLEIIGTDFSGNQTPIFKNGVWAI